MAWTDTIKSVRGHSPSDFVADFMPAFLTSSNEEGTPRYTVLRMGKNWQDSLYENTDDYNVFNGEPYTGEHIEGSDFFHTEGIDWDITYTFEGVRDALFGYTVDGRPIVYGEMDMNLDRLYYILVNRFNNGIDFVQEYLNKVMPYTVGDKIRKKVEPAVRKYREMVSRKTAPLSRAEKQMASADERVSQYQEAIWQAEEHELKDGSISANKNFVYHGDIERFEGMQLKEVHRLAREGLRRSYSARASAGEKIIQFKEALASGKIRINGGTWESESEKAAEMMRKDFIGCLHSGQVPLAADAFDVAVSTRKMRDKAGLPEFPRFFASGQFAESIQFSVRIKA